MKLCQINLKNLEIFAPINFRAAQKSFFRAYQLWEGNYRYPTSIISFFKFIFKEEIIKNSRFMNIKQP